MKLSNLLKGVASIGEGLASFNLFPSRELSKPRALKTPEQIRAEVNAALRSDWEAVGGDLRRAMDRMEKELQEKAEPTDRADKKRT